MKKNYIHPNAEVVEVDIHQPLLTGSDVEKALQNDPSDPIINNPFDII